MSLNLAIGFSILFVAAIAVALWLTDPGLRRSSFVTVEIFFRSVSREIQPLSVPISVVLVIVGAAYLLTVLKGLGSTIGIQARVIRDVLKVFWRYRRTVSSIQIVLIVLTHVTLLGTVSGQLSNLASARITALDRDAGTLLAAIEKQVQIRTLEIADRPNSSLGQISAAISDHAVPLYMAPSGRDVRKLLSDRVNRTVIQGTPADDRTSRGALMSVQGALSKTAPDRNSEAEIRKAIHLKVLDAASEAISQTPRAALSDSVSAISPLLSPFAEAIAEAIRGVAVEDFVRGGKVPFGALSSSESLKAWIEEEANRRFARIGPLPSPSSETRQLIEERQSVNAASRELAIRAQNRIRQFARNRDPLRSYGAWKQAIVRQYGDKWNEGGRISAEQERQWRTGVFSTRDYNFTSNIEFMSNGDILANLRYELDKLPDDASRLELLQAARQSSRNPFLPLIAPPPGPREISAILADRTGSSKWRRWAGHLGAPRYLDYSPAAVRALKAKPTPRGR